VLDADILVRAVFGPKVRELLEAFEEKVSFYARKSYLGVRGPCQDVLRSGSAVNALFLRCAVALEQVFFH